MVEIIARRDPTLPIKPITPEEFERLRQTGERMSQLASAQPDSTPHVFTAPDGAQYYLVSALGTINERQWRNAHRTLLSAFNRLVEARTGHEISTFRLEQVQP